MAPLEEPVRHDKAHAIAHRLVSDLSLRFPDEYILSAHAKRRGRIFLDYLRNGRGTTAVGAYSPRARPGFPIAGPVTWRDIEKGVRSDAFTLAKPPRES